MTTRILALLFLSTTLAGCGLDALEGKKSDFQTTMERRAAITLPPAAATEPTAPSAEEEPTIADTPAPAIEEATPTAPEPAAPAVCTPIFRVLSCGDNGEFIYL